MPKSIKYFKSYRWFHCSNCEPGYVTLFTRETREEVVQQVSKCNRCQHQYGIKSLTQLREYQDDTQGLPSRN